MNEKPDNCGEVTAETTHDAAGMRIKDSGTRRDFGTGSVRDAAAGKGRMDLLPVRALGKLFAAHCSRPLHQTFSSLYVPTNLPRGARCLDLSFRLALEHLRGCRENPCLLGATYFAMVALEMRERGLWDEHVYVYGDAVLLSWCPWSALIQVSKLFEAGCQKYGDRNWEKGQPLHIYMDSGLRHLAKCLRGDTDEDHLTAACWNFLCYLDTECRIEEGILPESLADGMPKPSPLPAQCG